MEFKSRAVWNLVELHKQEMLRFLEVWDRFLTSGLPMLEALGDPNYKDRELLCAHVVAAAREDLIWICEKVRRPVTHLDDSNDPYDIAARFCSFAEALFVAYQQLLADLTDQELTAPHPTKGGMDLNVEAILEHAIVHPMRHRIQLERILS